MKQYTRAHIEILTCCNKVPDPVSSLALFQFHTRPRKISPPVSYSTAARSGNHDRWITHLLLLITSPPSLWWLLFIFGRQALQSTSDFNCTWNARVFVLYANQMCYIAKGTLPTRLGGIRYNSLPHKWSAVDLKIYHYNINDIL